MRTEAARAAAAIRKHLKANNVPAKVTSNVYTGGSSVRVSLSSPLPATFKLVEEWARRHQEGSFNAMEDIYEYNNCNSEVPQAKFVFVEAHYSDEIREAAKQYVIDHSDIDGYRIDQVAYQVLMGSWGEGFWTDLKPRQRVDMLTDKD